MGAWMHGILDFLSQYGAIGLFVLTFVEASFFPVPPYLLSVPMTLANPHMGLFYAAINTAGSVLGGLLGYSIGLHLGQPVLSHLVKPTTQAVLERNMARFGGRTILVGGLLPIPYSVFAILAGVFRIRLSTFIPISIVSRGIRFVTEALFLMLYGGTALRLARQLLGPVNLALLALLVLFVTLVWHFGPLRKKWNPLAAKAWGRFLAWTAGLRKRFLKAGVFGWTLVTGASLAAFGSVLFAKLADDVLEKELSHFDKAVSGWIASWRTGWLTEVMRFASNLGGPFALTLVSIGLIFLFAVRHKQVLNATTLALCMVGGLGLSEWLKLSFHRPRPSLPWLVHVSGYSFPSGHALVSMSFFGFVAYLVLRSRLSPQNRIAAAALLFFPVLIGVSRIYLGVHYPTDVLGGWLAALTWVGACIVARESLSHAQSE